MRPCLDLIVHQAGLIMEQTDGMGAKAGVGHRAGTLQKAQQHVRARRRRRAAHVRHCGKPDLPQVFPRTQPEAVFEASGEMGIPFEVQFWSDLFQRHPGRDEFASFLHS